jgi:hypothetical protein
MNKNTSKTREVIVRIQPHELDEQPIFNEEGKKLLRYLEDLQFKYDVPTMRLTMQ